MVQAKVHKSERNGREAPRLFFCNYCGKWITRGEVKAERTLNKEHRMICRQCWGNTKLRSTYRHNADTPPHRLENILGS